MPADTNHEVATEVQQHVVDEQLAVADTLNAKAMATQAQTAATSKPMEQAGKVHPIL